VRIKSGTTAPKNKPLTGPARPDPTTIKTACCAGSHSRDGGNRIAKHDVPCHRNVMPSSGDLGETSLGGLNLELCDMDRVRSAPERAQSVHQVEMQADPIRKLDGESDRVLGGLGLVDTTNDGSLGRHDFAAVGETIGVTARLASPE
jgi:hypothetical protein